MSDSRPPDANDGPSYCRRCGSALDPGDSYCSDCGHEIGSGTSARPDESGRDSQRREFRHRVSTYLANGWDVEYDAGDEVVLVDRGFGSIGIHVLLFFLTGGFGNLLYGWYHYSQKASRIVLRADGTERPADSAADIHGYDDRSAPLSHYVFGVLLLLGGVFVIGTSLASFGSLLFGIGMVLVSSIVLPPARRRLRDRHPPSTFGPTQTVEERAVSGTDQLCSICREPVDSGVVREYEKEYVFAGLGLYTMEAGENWYCTSCHQDQRGFADGHTQFHEHAGDEPRADDLGGSDQTTATGSGDGDGETETEFDRV